MRFLVDAQLPPALARDLISLGHEAEHVFNIGLLSASDQAIWEHATRIGAVIVTKDEDFVTLKALRSDGPPIVWIRIGNTTRRALIARVSDIFPVILAALQRGEQVIEVSSD